MTNLQTDKQNVCLDLTSLTNICRLCVDQKDRLEIFEKSNAKCSVQLNQLKDENKHLRESKTDLVNKMKSDAKDNVILKDTINEQSLKIDIVYEHVEELTKDVADKEKELANAKVKIVELNRKFEQFRNSSVTLTNILGSQRDPKDLSGLGYTEVPPPYNDNYTKIPEEVKLTDAKEDSSLVRESENVQSDFGKDPMVFRQSNT